LSDITVSDILDSGHLPVVFHIMDPVKTSDLSEPTEKCTDWERFQNLVPELISPRIEINSGKEAKNAEPLQLPLLQHIGCRPVRLPFRT
jgi:hypothetical protein